MSINLDPYRCTADWRVGPDRCRPPVALAVSGQFSLFLASLHGVARSHVVQPLSPWAFPPVFPGHCAEYHVLLTSYKAMNSVHIPTTRFQLLPDIFDRPDLDDTVDIARRWPTSTKTGSGNNSRVARYGTPFQLQPPLRPCQDYLWHCCYCPTLTDYRNST